VCAGCRRRLKVTSGEPRKSTMRKSEVGRGFLWWFSRMASVYVYI
jgi:hypothetical protein